MKFIKRFVYFVYFSTEAQRLKLPNTVHFLAVVVKPLKKLNFVTLVKLPITARCCGRWCYALCVCFQKLQPILN